MSVQTVTTISLNVEPLLQLFRKKAVFSSIGMEGLYPPLFDIREHGAVHMR